MRLSRSSRRGKPAANQRHQNAKLKKRNPAFIANMAANVKKDRHETM
jgi:hypothetical protein